MDLCQVMLSGKSKGELKRLLLGLVFDGQPGRKNEKRTFIIEWALICQS